ncbi:MAG: hypothetical protein RMJ88_16485 [Thermogemmata sp.]|nr:hypothetical protein [Thermogemmata sp.]
MSADPKRSAVGGASRRSPSAERAGPDIGTTGLKAGHDNVRLISLANCRSGSHYAEVVGAPRQVFLLDMSTLPPPY